MLELQSGTLERTFRALRECGRGRCECVIYWTGPADKPLVDGQIHPVHKRSRLFYEIDHAWLTQLWRSLASSKRSIKAQIHTHPTNAFHSSTDDKWPIISQAGFVSIVIPDFAMGAVSFDRTWIGRLRDDGTWCQLSSADQLLRAS